MWSRLVSALAHPHEVNESDANPRDDHKRTGFIGRRLVRPDRSICWSIRVALWFGIRIQVAAAADEEAKRPAYLSGRLISCVLEGSFGFRWASNRIARAREVEAVSPADA
jgi:hypothetical protein